MAKRQMTGADSGEELSLVDAAEMILEECRTVLPGIQALFGFQLIAVFSSGFAQMLSSGEQRLHLTAITLVMLAAALIMSPAAFHRQQGAKELTWGFVTLASRLLLLSMPPLAVAMCLDLYLIARVILGGGGGAAALASLMFVTLIALWFVIPRVRVLRRALGRDG